jgi:hypothetical protein
LAHLILFIIMVKSPLIKITNSILHFLHFRNLFDTASVEKVVYFYSSPLCSFVIYFVIPVRLALAGRALWFNVLTFTTKGH